MVQFACVNCGAMIVTDVAVGGASVCQNCNTRQAVPKVAMESERRVVPHAASPAESMGRHVGRLRDQLPGYPLVLVAGWAMMIGGGIAIVVAIAASGGTRSSEWINGVSGVLGGLFSMGLGQVFHCIRDMAMSVQSANQRPR